MPPAVPPPPPHMEFLVIFFNIYVSFHTHSSFLKMLNGITCRELFKGCTAVFSDMRLISNLQSQNRLGTSFSTFKTPLVAQLRKSVLK